MGGSAGRGSRAGAALVVRALVLVLLATALACSREVREHPGGVKRSAGRRLWLGGVEDGLWTYWYPSGGLREQGRYVRGRREGVWEQWYPNGVPRSRGRRAWNAAEGRGEREGVWTFWHENGLRHAVGVFRAGRREGHWDFDLKDGRLDAARTGEYHDGVRID